MNAPLYKLHASEGFALSQLAARIRELEGALRALLSITRPGPHDRSAKDEPHVELCRRWNDARRVLGGAA